MTDNECAILLAHACGLTLIFHFVGVWDVHKQLAWDRALGGIYYPRPVPSHDATTRVLCDAVREALERIRTARG